MLRVESALERFIKTYPELANKRWVIGYSGGRDSHVLLHSLATFLSPSTLKAIHVNHQINPQASTWAQHCERTAQALGIECQILKVALELDKGESLEAKARKLRYQAIQAHLEEEDVLLTAHTQDDQAETLLLQLIRGAGVQGLSSMGECKPFGKNLHYRPLLSVTREEIEKASLAYSISWITDDSNENRRFDRNFIRHEILPLLKDRFKGVVPSLARSAQLCQEAANTQMAQAALDFQTIASKKRDQIDTSTLNQLSVERQKAVIRYWIFQNNHLYPSKAKLEDILNQMNHASWDAMPCIRWGESVLRRYKQHWYLSKIEPREALDFSLEKVQGRGLNLALIADLSKLTIKLRKGGERCKPVGQPFSKSLKKWFQIFEIPVWMRESIPLIYYQETLIGVLGHFICEGWQVAGKHEWGLEVALKSSK